MTVTSITFSIDENYILPASPIWCKLQYISTIFSDSILGPCCLAEGLLHSVHKEIIDAMLITQI